VKKEAAELLGMKRTTLIQKMKRNKIEFQEGGKKAESSL
jgi:DNA-binding NtrC family response regulator